MINPDDKVEIVAMDMDEERKQKFFRAADAIIRVCRDECKLTPIEAYAVLKLCLEVLGKGYDIKDSFMLTSPTEMEQ